MPTRFLAVEDIAPEQTWQLVEWCIAHGAEEFGLTLMGLQGYSEPFNDRFLAAVAPFKLAEANRPHALTYVGQESVRETPFGERAANSSRN